MGALATVWIGISVLEMARTVSLGRRELCGVFVRRGRGAGQDVGRSPLDSVWNEISTLLSWEIPKPT